MTLLRHDRDRQAAVLLLRQDDGLTGLAMFAANPAPSDTQKIPHQIFWCGISIF
jgi:hypothetical protein